jgi:hypothetical protein
MQVDHNIYGLTINTSASLTSRGSATLAYKLSRLLFSGVLASHAGSPGSIPGRNLSQTSYAIIDRTVLDSIQFCFQEQFLQKRIL